MFQKQLACQLIGGWLWLFYIDVLKIGLLSQTLLFYNDIKNMIE